MHASRFVVAGEIAGKGIDQCRFRLTSPDDSGNGRGCSIWAPQYLQCRYIVDRDQGKVASPTVATTSLVPAVRLYIGCNVHNSLLMGKIIFFMMKWQSGIRPSPVQFEDASTMVCVHGRPMILEDTSIPQRRNGFSGFLYIFLIFFQLRLMNNTLVGKPPFTLLAIILGTKGQEFFATLH